MVPGHPQLPKPRVCDPSNYSCATIITIAVGKKKAYLQLLALLSKALQRVQLCQDKSSVGVANVAQKEICLLAQKFRCPRLCCTRGAQHCRIILSASRVCDAGTASTWEAEGTNAVPLETTLHSMLSWLSQGKRGGLSPTGVLALGAYF